MWARDGVAETVDTIKYIQYLGRAEVARGHHEMVPPQLMSHSTWTGKGLDNNLSGLWGTLFPVSRNKLASRRSDDDEHTERMKR